MEASTQHRSPQTCVTHSPQPPGALRLVDVDEVGHHAALEQTALGLHSDLEQNDEL